MINNGDNQMGKHVTQKRTDVIYFRNPMKYCNEIRNIAQVRKWPLRNKYMLTSEVKYTAI